MVLQVIKIGIRNASENCQSVEVLRPSLGIPCRAEEVLRRQCQDAKNICQKDTSPLSPLLDAEEANEKSSCYHFLGLNPAQEASLVLEAWNEMLNSCYDDSISDDKDDLTRPSGCSESQREIDNVMQPHHFILNIVQVDIFEGHAESYSDHDSGFDCDRVTFPTQDPEFGDNKIAITWSPKEVFGFQTLTNNALNYEDRRVNGVFNDQDHTTQVALRTLEDHPWPSSDLKCDDATFLTSSSGFEVDQTVAFMSPYGTLVEAVWDGAPNSEENEPEDLMPKVEFRIAEPNGPYDKSTEILDNFNYERDKPTAQIEIASQSSVPRLYNATNLSFFVIDCDSDLCNNYYILSTDSHSTGRGTGWKFRSPGHTSPLDDHNELLPLLFDGVL
ncbi:hypothetical protein V8E54_014498 [Elaphomyces granulatus]